MGPDGALCRWQISQKEERYSAVEWNKVRFGSISTDAAGYGEFKKLLLKACEKLNCTLVERAAINGFIKNIDGIRGRK